MANQVIQCEAIRKSFGDQLLFDGLDLVVNQGECFALIGENGSGKTTLLRVLVGLEEVDAGRVVRTAGHVGLLLQEVEGGEMLVREYIEEGPLKELERAMTDCLERGELEEWGRLEEEYRARGGYRQLPLERVLRDWG